MNTTLWSTAEVSAHTGLSTSSVSRWAQRHGIRPVRYGRSETNRATAFYSAEQVKQARAAQPGSGNRTPRKAEQS